MPVKGSFKRVIQGTAKQSQIKLIRKPKKPNQAALYTDRKRVAGNTGTLNK